MIDEPEHTYASPGAYTVALTIRDIRTGQVMVSATQNLQAEANSEAASSDGSASSSAPSQDSSSSAATQTAGSGTLRSIVWVGLIVSSIIALGILLFVVFWWIKRKTAGRLHETLERMENTLVAKDAQADADSSDVQTLKLKKQPKTKKEPESEPDFSMDAPAEQRKAPATAPAQPTDAPVPAWLKPKTTAEPPVSAPVAPTQTSTAEPVISVQDTGPVPDWLKPSLSQTPTAPSESDQPLTEESDAPDVTIEKNQGDQPVSNDSVPDWLKNPPSASAEQSSGDTQVALTSASSEPVPAPSVQTPVETKPVSAPDWLKEPAAPAETQTQSPAASAEGEQKNDSSTAQIATPAHQVPAVTPQPQPAFVELPSETKAAITPPISASVPTTKPMPAPAQKITSIPTQTAPRFPSLPQNQPKPLGAHPNTGQPHSGQQPGVPGQAGLKKKRKRKKKKSSGQPGGLQTQGSQQRPSEPRIPAPNLQQKPTNAPQQQFAPRQPAPNLQPPKPLIMQQSAAINQPVPAVAAQPQPPARPMIPSVEPDLPASPEPPQSPLAAPINVADPQSSPSQTDDETPIVFIQADSISNTPPQPGEKRS